MTDFVAQCRLEWKRLGVPEPLAEEMATELAADLSEAEAEGVSAEEFLGADARSFAASWAGERGIVPVPPGRAKGRRRPFALVAFTAVAAIVLIVTALLLLTGQPRATLTASETPETHHQLPAVTPFGSVGTGRHVLLLGNLAAPVEWILLIFAIVALGFAVWLWSSWGRSRPPGVSA